MILYYFFTVLTWFFIISIAEVTKYYLRAENKLVHSDNKKTRIFGIGLYIFSTIVLSLLLLDYIGLHTNTWSTLNLTLIEKSIGVFYCLKYVKFKVKMTKYGQNSQNITFFTFWVILWVIVRKHENSPLRRRVHAGYRALKTRFLDSCEKAISDFDVFWLDYFMLVYTN